MKRIATSRLMLAVLGAVALLAVLGTAAWGLTAFHKVVTGLGSVDWVDEVSVVGISQAGTPTNTRVVVRLASTAQTVPDHSYTLRLYLNDEPAASQTVSWTAPQIPGGVKTVTFSGLNVSSVTRYSVEVEP